MDVLLHQGGLDGFLTALALALKEGASSIQIASQSRWEGDLFSTPRFIATDSEYAERVARRIEKRWGREVLKTLMSAHQSEEDGIETDLFNYLTQGLRQGKEAFVDYSHPSVQRVLAASRRTHAEIHRYLGILRFRELAEGAYYAAFEPDCDVLPLLSDHFRDRFADQEWMIHDQRRNSILLGSHGSVEHVYLDENDNGLNKTIRYSSEEDVYSQIWKRYHASISIEARENPACQRRHLPLKVRHHLVEFENDE